MELATWIRNWVAVMHQAQPRCLANFQPACFGLAPVPSPAKLRPVNSLVVPRTVAPGAAAAGAAHVDAAATVAAEMKEAAYSVLADLGWCPAAPPAAQVVAGAVTACLPQGQQAVQLHR